MWARGGCLHAVGCLTCMCVHLYGYMCVNGEWRVVFIIAEPPEACHCTSQAKKSAYRGQLEPMLLTHVAPLFASSHG